jgi:hypothetical protein
MDLSQFTSLFEILATFNFAYTLADTFTSSLNDKMLSVFQNVRKNLINIESKMNLAKLTLFETKPVEVGNKSTATKIQECIEGQNKHQVDLENLKTRMEKNFSLSGLTKSFKYLCFFSALYSVLVLVPIGFLKQQPGLILNTCSIQFALFITSILYIIFQIFWIRRDRIHIQENDPDSSIIGYRRTLITFGRVVLIGAAVYFLKFYLFRLTWDNNYCNTALILLTLLAPSIHFIYYFYRAYRNAKFLGDRYNNEVQGFENGYDKWFKTQTEYWISFHKSYQEVLGSSDNETAEKTSEQ